MIRSSGHQMQAKSPLRWWNRRMKLPIAKAKVPHSGQRFNGRTSSWTLLYILGVSSASIISLPANRSYKRTSCVSWLTLDDWPWQVNWNCVSFGSLLRHLPLQLECNDWRSSLVVTSQLQVQPRIQTAADLLLHDGWTGNLEHHLIPERSAHPLN